MSSEICLKASLCPMCPMCSALQSFTNHEKRQTLQPLVAKVKGAPGSCPCTSACFTSSPSVHPQIALSAMVCLRAVFHYPASVSVPLQDWPHLNMPSHHLLLNGPLWSKCQTDKLLKKKCSHLLSWHFPLRPIPVLLAFFSPLLLFLLPLGRSLNRGVFIKHTLYCKLTRVLTVCMYMYFTFSHFNTHFEPKMNNLPPLLLASTKVSSRSDWHLSGSDVQMRCAENRSQIAQFSHPLPQPNPVPWVISGKTRYGLAQLSAGEEVMLVID